MTSERATDQRTIDLSRAERPAAALRITTTGSSHDQRVALRGRLDVSTVGDVRTCLHDLLGEGTGDLLVDVADVDVADATGLGVLVGAHRRAERLERHLVLVGVTPKLTRLLRLTRLHRILRVRVEAAAA